MERVTLARPVRPARGAGHLDGLAVAQIGHGGSPVGIEEGTSGCGRRRGGGQSFVRASAVLRASMAALACVIDRSLARRSSKRPYRNCERSIPWARAMAYSARTCDGVAGRGLDRPDPLHPRAASAAE